MPTPAHGFGTPPDRHVVDGLLQQVSAGSDEAFDALYHAFAPYCLGLARRIVVDLDLSNDVVQQAFVAVWQGAGRFDPARGSGASWLMAITHHKAVDCVRSEQHRRDHQAPEALLADLASQLPGPDNAACASDDRSRVRGALASLPARQRDALLLAYFGGYSYSEVSTLVSAPLGTVKSRCRDGMATLRRELSAAGMRD